MISQEMKEERKQGIGGSDAACIMGYDKYKNINQLYYEKIGEWEPELTPKQQRRCDLGNFLEPWVAQCFEEDTGKKVYIDETYYKHKEYDFMRANIDRNIEGENAVLECKTAAEYRGKEWGDNEVPAQYYFQVMHYIAVLNLDHAYIAVQIGMSDFKFLKIDRNEEVINKMIEKEKAFWECVENRTPPVAPVPLIEEKEEEIKLTPTLAERIKLLKDTQSHIKDMKKIEEEVKEEIKEHMKEYTKGICEGWKVTYKTQVRKDLDKAALKKEYPNLYNQFIKENKTRVLNIK